MIPWRAECGGDRPNNPPAGIRRRRHPISRDNAERMRDIIAGVFGVGGMTAEVIIRVVRPGTRRRRRKQKRRRKQLRQGWEQARQASKQDRQLSKQAKQKARQASG